MQKKHQGGRGLQFKSLRGFVQDVFKMHGDLDPGENEMSNDQNPQKIDRVAFVPWWCFGFLLFS